MSASNLIWEEELESLKAIYGDVAESNGNIITASIEGITMTFEMPDGYPETIPLVSPQIPGIVESAMGMAGRAMLFDLVLLILEGRQQFGDNDSQLEDSSVMQQPLIESDSLTSKEGWCKLPGTINISAISDNLRLSGYSIVNESSSVVSWMHRQTGIFIELNNASVATDAAPFIVTADGVEEDCLIDAVIIFLSNNVENSFGKFLIDWVTEARNLNCVDTPGFCDVGDLDTPAQISDFAAQLFLPPPSAADSSRELVILTWGRAIMKKGPMASQQNFNAAVLNGRGHGVDLRKMNGLSSEVQNVVMRCRMFPDFLSMMISAIEQKRLTCISINCAKGRHRSVAAAEILKKIYYPNARIEHLTIT